MRKWEFDKTSLEFPAMWFPPTKSIYSHSKNSKAQVAFGTVKKAYTWVHIFLYTNKIKPFIVEADTSNCCPRHYPIYVRLILVWLSEASVFSLILFPNTHPYKDQLPNLWQGTSPQSLSSIGIQTNLSSRNQTHLIFSLGIILSQPDDHEMHPSDNHFPNLS